MSDQTTPPAVPPVPYGPPATSPGDGSVGAPPTMITKLTGHPAVKWGLRALLPVVLRIIFRALFRR